ncbi:MAG: hypothetical protein AAF573_20455, partial [Bacteroidota bacterium]
MKHFTLCSSFLFFTLSLFSQIVETDWTSLNLNEPVGKYVHATSVVNENVIWGLPMTQNGNFITGDQFFRTLDGGQTFEIDTLPFSLTDIFSNNIQALDENIAIIASSSLSTPFREGIYKTIDGGQTWELLYDAEAFEVQPLEIHFFNNADGIFIGAVQEGNTFVAVLYYTQDGGDSWTLSSGQISTSYLFAFGGNNIKEVVGDTIWIASDRILRSTDKGQTWEEFDIGIQDGVASDVAFKDATNGLTVVPTNTNLDP